MERIQKAFPKVWRGWMGIEHTQDASTAPHNGFEDLQGLAKLEIGPKGPKPQRSQDRWQPPFHGGLLDQSLTRAKAPSPEGVYASRRQTTNVRQ